MLDAPQGSDAWKQSRLGKVTASRISAVLSKGRNGGIPVTRNNYMDDLIAERVLGVPTSYVTNDAMAWGSQCEAEARTFYSLMKDVDVEQVGFIDHPTIPMAGASLDGLVGCDGFLECKCPQSRTHMETIRKGCVPPQYIPQILWGAACRPERKWCDFVSFDPRLDLAVRLFVKRVVIDRAEVARLEDEVRQFMIDMEPIEARVRAFVKRTNGNG
jgi:putative phage-type endonuclease